MNRKQLFNRYEQLIQEFIKWQQQGDILLAFVCFDKIKKIRKKLEGDVHEQRNRKKYRRF